MVSDLETIKKELQFIGRTVANGYVDFDALDEMGRAVQNALASLESHELTLMPEVEEEALAA